MGLDEPLSPVEIESRLRRGITALTQAQTKLEQARNNETDAELAYKASVYRATLDPACPKVGRGAQDASVAERDAWVGERTFDAYRGYRWAVTTREAAQDHLRTTRDIIEVLRSLGASVRTAYEGAGWGSERGQR